MKQRIQILLASLVMMAGMFGQAALPRLAYADASCGDGSGSSKDQVLEGVGETDTDCRPGKVADTINGIVRILSYILGAAAIIVIIIGGFKFITSGGDANKVSSAKSTIVYALIGLAIAVFAQFLVHFVINTAQNTVDG
jgi:hypothetical protein